MKLIDPSGFTSNIAGKNIALFTLKNIHGLVCQITNYGGRVVSFFTPDRNGRFEDIVLGYDSLNAYIQLDNAFFGALIGRYGNRIAKSCFSLNEKVYSLTKNNGKNHLHGGNKGFHHVIWNAEQLSGTALALKYLAKDGEEGYPGNLAVSVIYELTNDNALKITYTATTDKATPVNLTHHSYFNLDGAGKGSIDDHVLKIDADYYTPVTDEMIPQGEIASVKNTPFDFTQPTPIGKRIHDDNKQLKFGSGYDHNYVLKGSGIRKVARVWSPLSGRVMEVISDEPGMQLYTGNFVQVVEKGKNRQSYSQRSGFCLETQHFPDSPNQPDFPSTILAAGDTYRSTCIYRFDTIS